MPRIKSLVEFQRFWIELHGQISPANYHKPNIRCRNQLERMETKHNRKTTNKQILWSHVNPDKLQGNRATH